MTTTKKIYRGFLRLGSNGEEDDILFLLDIATQAVPLPKFIHTVDLDPLSTTIADDIEAHGQYLTVRYFTANQALSEEELTLDLIKTVSGAGESKYEMHYSDITGYLYTIDDTEVGGHNLHRELLGQVGRFCHLDITYSTEPVPSSGHNLHHDVACLCPSHFQGASGPIQVYSYGKVGVLEQKEDPCKWCGVSRVKHTDEKCRRIMQLQKIRAALLESLAIIDKGIALIKESVE